VLTEESVTMFLTKHRGTVEVHMQNYKHVNSSLSFEIDLVILVFDVFDMHGCIFV